MNHIVQHDANRVFFRSEGRGMIHTILLTKLRKALKELFIMRTLVRKQLQAFTSYTSALFGLMANIFKELAIVSNGRKGLRLTMKGVRFYLSGCDKAVRDLEIAKETGAEFILMSYWWLRNQRDPFRHAKRLGLKVLLDSGAYTAFKKGEVIPVQEYASFLLTHQEFIHAFITLDVIGDPEASRLNDQYLREHDLNPIPVFSFFDEPDRLSKLMEEDHAWIAIGGTVGLKEQTKEDFFHRIFQRYPDGRFHWLGGSSKLLRKFPWFSADSSTWLSGRKYGKIVDGDFQTQQKPVTMSPSEALSHNVKHFISLEEQLIDRYERLDENRYSLLAAS